MKKISYDDIELAFMFVSSQPEFMNQALLSKSTGEIFYISDDIDADDLPDDIEDSDDYLSIPHQNELDLGKELISQFISEHLPEETHRIYQFFRQKGAYSKYKDFLFEKGLLDTWHEYEDNKRSDALRNWCADNNIEIIG